MAKKISEMEGMGDLIALVTEKTGIKKVVEAVVEDCGCDERQEKLNVALPFKRGKKRDK
jgi:hypothetical protein